MTCTVGGDIDRENMEIYWNKFKYGNETQRVFLFVNSRDVHRAKNDLPDASNKPRAVGQLVGFVYHLYINNTVLSDDAQYSCYHRSVGDMRRLIVNGE